MNNPRLSESDISIDTPSIGGFSLDDLGILTESDAPIFRAESNQPKYQIIVKRDDGLYKTLHILNTVFSILAVLMIVAIFIMVFYGLVTITQVAQIVGQVKEHNALVQTPIK